MKKTSTLFLLLLLTVMGAQAATKTIYCKCAQAWWKEAGAAVAVHYWGSATSGTSWPGERMTPVPGETDLWTADVPDDLTGIMFVRVNGAGAVSDWGAKTADLTLPADEKNMYTITSESPVWGDPGAAGAWGIYTPPTVRHFYVAGNGTAGNAWCDGKSWDVAGSEIVDGSVTFSNVPAGDYQFKLTAGAWETNWGFDALSRDCPTWLVCSSDANNNICFTNPSTQDITITFDGTSICLVANLPVHYYVAGNGTAGNTWCDGKSWDVAGSEIVDGSVTFYDVPAGEYEFRVTPGKWDYTWGHGDLSSSVTEYLLSSSFNIDNNIIFRTDHTQSITITFDGEHIGLNASTCLERPTFDGSVPEQCHDVMLQAFYWDSYDAYGRAYGDTKWETLIAQAETLGQHFDMIWLPPSARSMGGTGYMPKEYHNQNSDWGSVAQLRHLINLMHQAGTRVIADIVVNHLDTHDSWCDFYTQYFIPYGIHTPTMAWVCRDDEVNENPEAGDCYGTATGTWDDGQGSADSERDFNGTRDLDHCNADVRNMCKDYLKWMKNVIGFDGWRYDFAKGFHVSHIDDYNSAAANYFSVMEYWDANVGTIQARLNDANWNTTAFDYATKYSVFNNGINNNNFQPLQTNGSTSMLGAGLSRYAVTFVDNHDSFKEGYNRAFDPADAYYATKVKQANAWLLSMPGIPCVFYPHWYEFSEQIAPMIAARKAVGVHSESAVQDMSANGYYDATVTGTNGTLILRMGSRVSEPAPSGFTLAVDGTMEGYQIYTRLNTPTAIEETQAMPELEKIIENGQVIIIRDGIRYNALGQRL